MKTRFMSVLILALFMLLAVVPVAAQEAEATPEPVEEPPVIITEPEPVASTYLEDLLALVRELDTEENWLSLEGGIFAILLAASSGGIIGFVTALQRNQITVDKARAAYDGNELVRVLGDLAKHGMNTAERVVFYMAPGSKLYKQIDTIEDLTDQITGEQDVEPDGDNSCINPNGALIGTPVQVSENPLRLRPGQWNLISAGVDTALAGVGFDPVSGYVFNNLAKLNGEIGFSQSLTLEPGTYTLGIVGSGQPVVPDGIQATIWIEHGGETHRFESKYLHGDLRWVLSVSTRADVTMGWVLVGRGQIPQGGADGDFAISSLCVKPSHGDFIPNLSL